MGILVILRVANTPLSSFFLLSVPSAFSPSLLCLFSHISFSTMRDYPAPKSPILASTQLRNLQILPPQHQISPSSQILGKNLNNSATFLLNFVGDSELQTCVKGQPCNLVFSYFNSPIDWASVRCTERPQQFRVREQGLDVFRADSCGFVLHELGTIGVCSCV